MSHVDFVILSCVGFFFFFFSLSMQIAAMAAVKFPTLEVNYSDGTKVKLPNTSKWRYCWCGQISYPKGIFAMSFIPSKLAGIEL